jgi:hypothetical protein
VACAAALVDHGLPILELDGQYSDEVTAYLDEQRNQIKASSSKT